MKKHLYFIWALLVLVSCSDFLDVEPDLQISNAELLSTRDGVLAAVSGIYTDIEVQVSSKVHTYPGIMSGNMSFSPSTTTGEVRPPSTVIQTYNFNNIPEESDFETFYEDGYNIVNQANLILENLEQFDFFTATELEQLEAELLVARAFAHYQIALLHSQNINFTADGSHLGIVYNTRTLQAGVDFPSKATAQETYDFLKADLDRALTLFTGTPIISGSPDTSVFNPVTTNAFYAKVALQYNDWQRAADLAQQAITLSGKMLTPTGSYIDQWLTNEDLDETILSFTNPRDSDGEVTSSISAYYQYDNNLSYGSFIASGDLLALYDSNDLRNQLYTSQELSTATPDGREDREYTFSLKYQEDNSTLYTRLSDLYLIQAEALERVSPGNPIALERLNAIRTRAGLDELTSSVDLLEDIYLERRRELAFEAHIFYDVIRYRKNIIRDLGCVATTCNLSYPSPFYILPIPLKSISNNANMQQNEGY